MTQALAGLGGGQTASRLGAAGDVSPLAAGIGRTCETVEGLALIRPVYVIAAAVVASAAYVYGGIESASFAIAAAIAIWAFVEPRTTLWLCTAYMIFLFVFFQSEAPLGEEVPEEFVYWGVGLAIITAGLVAATFFSSQIDGRLVRKRLAAGISKAMLAMLLVILAATAYGLFSGNQMFAVMRQLYGCLLLPVFYFLGMVLFRTAADVDLWLRRVSWAVAISSAWYVQRLALLSIAHGTYYREQSPLVAYSGAIAVVAWTYVVARRRMVTWLQSLGQLVVCLAAIVLMGNRAALGSFLIASLAVTLLAIWKRGLLLLGLVACMIPVAIGIAPYVTAQLAGSRGLAGYIADRFLIVVSEDRSYQGRVAQTEVVMNMVQKQPILGAGMGSENTFILPGEQRRIKVASVDNGWGYLILKMGYLGLIVFLILIGLLLKRAFTELDSIRNVSLRANRLALAGIFVYALVNFAGGPIFFHFSAAPFFATTLGAMAVLGEVRELSSGAPPTQIRDQSRRRSRLC